MTEIPTTDEVRHTTQRERMGYLSPEGFDSWLIELKATIWQEGYGDDLECETPRTNPYRRPRD